MQAADKQGISNGAESLQTTLRTSLYGLFVAAFVLVGAVILASNALFPADEAVTLQAGEVAPHDILAPRSLKYESEVLTEAKRNAAIAAVRPIYDPPDLAVRNEQMQRARQILDFIENVRYDDFATTAQKAADISAIADLHLAPGTIEALLAIDDPDRWRDIDAQVVRLLERVMSGEVRQDNIQAKREDLPNLISATYSEAEVQVITGIVGDLIRPNTFYNEELTRQAQLEAAESVPAETRSFVRGQVIIRAGEIASAAHIEALEQFGLLQPARRKFERFAGALLTMLFLTTVLGLYLRKFDAKVLHDPPFFMVLAIVFLLFLGSVRVLNADDRVQPYFFPASALALLTATLVGPQFAILTNMLFAGAAGLAMGNSLEFAILIGLTGTLGVLSLDRTERLNAYFMAGLVICVTAMGVAALFALQTEGSPDLVIVFSQVLGAMVNGLLSAAVGLVGLFVISHALNIPTSLKLVELMQPNHALLQRLLREAPGTYQHSLQVANLAELGAQRVNADAGLVRVAAMYHDVGKILNPHFFIENQADGFNPHDVLDDPVQSARIIIGHVTEGLRLARQYRLPLRLRDFIAEHHGTLRVAYFLHKAQEAGGSASVDLAAFTYPGPRPRSRETAILMLADGCESSVRARRPQSKEDIRETIDFIFEERLRDGQLDDSGLTLNDLRLLRDTFLTALQGVFHPRIAYPGTPTQAAAPAEAKPAHTDDKPLPGRSVTADAADTPLTEKTITVPDRSKTNGQPGIQRKAVPRPSERGDGPTPASEEKPAESAPNATVRD
jgi:putative nucleotidyltransferase with HDIG domain